jgi:uncharacterized Fe-S cluster-containing radical SAM superfamily protein
LNPTLDQTLRRGEGPRVRRVTIETVSACNLRCIHCAVSKDDYVGRVLKLEDFRRILPLLQRFKPVVQLSGHGETLMHKHFREMFLDVIGAGCAVTFQTNAALLDGDTIDFLLQHAGRPKFRALRVSLDAAEPELFEKIRRRAKWDELMTNLRALRDAKAQRGLFFPLLHLEFVAMRQNIHQLADVVDRAAELGAATLAVGDLSEYPLCAGQNLRNDLPGTIPHLRRGIERAKEIGFTLEPFPGIKELLEPDAQAAAPAAAVHETAPAAPGANGHASARTRLRLCTDPWEFMFLQADGSFIPCCWITEPIIPAGEKDVLAAWNGDAYTKLRAALSSKELPKTCSTCYSRPWTEVPDFVVDRPNLVHALFRSREVAEKVRKNVRGLAKHTGGFTRPDKMLKVLRGMVGL